MVSKIALWITASLTGAGYFGVLILMALESACVPLPSEIIMPFAGYLVSIGKLNLSLTAIAGALGCNLGSWPAYELARREGQTAVKRYGKWVLLTEKDVAKSTRFFQRYGALAVFIGRLLPGIRSFVAVPAGLARMPRGPFHLLTFVGSLPWCFTLAWIGMKLGQQWNTDPRFATSFHRFQLVVGVIALALVLVFVFRRVKTSRS